MNRTNEIEIINQIRAEVMSRKDRTGRNLFLIWGYPTVVVLLLEFAVLMLWGGNWFVWLWAGIPLVGVPLMIRTQRQDYARTGRRTLEQNITLQLWMFIGATSCLAGFVTGCAGVYEQCYCTLQGILLGMGCFLTGVTLRFRPIKRYGIAGALLSFSCLFFLGTLWPWQLLITAVIAFITLVIPGHLLLRYKI
ncbi:MAG: hypothetical protein K6B45_05675 [Bacteroidaceae bacterium]|jgi:hypothetical protein|nr:hypothetical protein [Bacteroidaceae bacterium]